MGFASMLGAAATIGVAAHPLAAQQDTSHHVRKAAQKANSLKAQARITEDSARVIALAGLPAGSMVRESELEREKGTIVWSFDIKAPGRTGIEEVLVSALDAHVVSKSHETPKMEAAEAARDRRAAKKP